MKIDYLDLINQVAKFTAEDEKDDLRNVYNQLSEGTSSKFQNSRSSWSWLRFYCCVYIDRTLFRQLIYTRLTFSECITMLHKYLKRLESAGGTVE